MIELVEVKHYDATPEICPQCLEPMESCACDAKDGDGYSLDGFQWFLLIAMLLCVVVAVTDWIGGR